jgi:hypothetical protein
MLSSKKTNAWHDRVIMSGVYRQLERPTRRAALSPQGTPPKGCRNLVVGQLHLVIGATTGGI